MVGFDASFLSLLLHPNPRAPLDPRTKTPVHRAKEKIEYLLETLEKAKVKILIPTPALSEVLALALDKSSEYLAQLGSSYNFEIASFDERAAIEAAIQTADAKRRGDKKGGTGGSWAKVKFDRQIVAIAKVRGVDIIYSDDEDVSKFAKLVNIRVIGVRDLPEPPPKQETLPYDDE